MSIDKKPSVSREDWARSPGDHFEIEATIEKYDFPEVSPWDFFQAGKAACDDAYEKLEHEDYDENWDEAIRHTFDLGMVKIWIAASNGILEACISLGHAINNSVRLEPPLPAFVKTYVGIAEAWLVRGDRTRTRQQRDANRLPLQRGEVRTPDDISDLMDFSASPSEDGMRQRVSRPVSKKQRDVPSIRSVRDAQKNVSAVVEDPYGLVVVPEVGDSSSGEGANIKKRFAHIVGRVLPSRRIYMPAPDEIGNAILAEWPWATSVASHIEAMLTSQRYVRLARPLLKPMLFVGLPGSGKTALAIKIAELFGLPSHVVAVGGTADAGGLSAVARGWSTSRPCGPVMAISHHMCCDPAIIVDELDKSQSLTARNGSVAGALLGMLSAPGRFNDTSLMADVDLSQVTFMATSNSISALPEALLDRFSIFNVPRPSAEHFDVILANVEMRYAKELGVHVGVLPVLDPDERELMRRTFLTKSGSLRDIERAYRHVVSVAAKRLEGQPRFLN